MNLVIIGNLSFFQNLQVIFQKFRENRLTNQATKLFRRRNGIDFLFVCKKKYVLTIGLIH